MRSLTTKVVVGLMATTGLLLADNQSAQADYPEKPIKVIVGFRAGGATDTLAKVVTAAMSKEVGVSVVTSNVTGAGGAVGALEAAKAKPDGYTLSVCSNGTMAVSPQAAQTGYTHKDFAPIGKWASVPNGWFVKTDSPYKTLDDLVSALKDKPGAKYTTVGTGSSVHLGAAVWADEAGLKLVHLGNRGGQGAVTKLLSGEVEFILTSASRVPGQVEEGTDMRPLAVSSDGPWKFAPSVPTLQSAGYDLVQSSWWGLCAPKDIAADRRDFLIEATKNVMTSSEVDEKLSKLYFEIDYKGPEGMEKDIEAALKDHQAGLKAVGLLKNPISY